MVLKCLYSVSFVRTLNFATCCYTSYLAPATHTFTACVSAFSCRLPTRPRQQPLPALHPHRLFCAELARESHTRNISNGTQMQKRKRRTGSRGHDCGGSDAVDLLDGGKAVVEVAHNTLQLADHVMKGCNGSCGKTVNAQLPVCTQRKTLQHIWSTRRHTHSAAPPY